MTAFEWGFEKPINRVAFARASEACHQVCSNLKNILLAGWDGSGSPLFNSSIICFNGANLEAAQTFQVRVDGAGSNSCETDNYPYDIAVRCCLLILEHFVEGFFFVPDHQESAWSLAEEIIESQLDILTGAKIME